MLLQGQALTDVYSFNSPLVLYAFYVHFQMATDLQSGMTSWRFQANIGSSFKQANRLATEVLVTKRRDDGSKAVVRLSILCRKPSCLFRQETGLNPSLIVALFQSINSYYMRLGL